MSNPIVKLLKAEPIWKLELMVPGLTCNSIWYMLFIVSAEVEQPLYTNWSEQPLISKQYLSTKVGVTVGVIDVVTVLVGVILGVTVAVAVTVGVGVGHIVPY